jgi:hypothetical protein
LISSDIKPSTTAYEEIHGKTYKRHSDEAIASHAAEELIHNNIRRPNPGDEVEILESLEQVSREEIPDEGTSEDKEEPLVTADSPTSSLQGVARGMIVKGVEESTVD